MKSAALVLLAAMAANVSAAGDKAYLFSYFTDKAYGGRKGEAAGLHLAYSYDGMKWTALNGDRPLLVPEVGKDKLMRDPSLVRGPDGTFHLVWTSSWHDRIIGYASSKDLFNWSGQRAIPVMEHEPEARNSWAPELTFDPDDGRFYIYWATTIPGRHSPIPGMEAKEDKLNHRIYMTSTKDWKDFAKTRIWFNPGFSAIDAALVRIEGGEKKWLMVVKNENHTPVEKNIRTVWIDDLSKDVPVDGVSRPITGNWVEGPSPLAVGESIIVYFDCYRRHCYGAVRSDDKGRTWRDISGEISMPKGMRHGTALAVDKDFVDTLVAADAARAGTSGGR